MVEMGPAIRLSIFNLLAIATELTMANDEGSHVPSQKANDVHILNSLEAPIILGVAVVGLLLGCALYHLCYRRFRYRNRRSNWIATHENGIRSLGELPTTRVSRSVLERLYGSSQRQGQQSGQSSTDNPPDYNDLPPSYTKATTMTSNIKDFLSPISRSSIISSTTSEEPPPLYDDAKGDSILSIDTHV